MRKDDEDDLDKEWKARPIVLLAEGAGIRDAVVRTALAGLDIAKDADVASIALRQKAIDEFIALKTPVQVAMVQVDKYKAENEKLKGETRR